MKTWTKMMTVAALAMTTLPAATVVRTAVADVPFPFQISGRQMPAGKYTIGRTATGAYIVENAVTRTAAVFQAPVRTTGKPGAGKIEFKCAAEACEIESVRFQGDPITYKRPFPANKRNAIAPTAASVNLSQD